MVARHYFNHSKPHLDDQDLCSAIRDEIVPGELDADGRWAGGCLRGGPFILELHRAGQDPCASCEAPRDRCGGRPAAEVRAVAAETRVTWSEGADARRVQRRGVIQGILRLVKPPPA